MKATYHVINGSCSFGNKTAFQFNSGGTDFSVLVNVILIRVAKPQIHADCFCILIMIFPASVIMVYFAVICISDEFFHTFCQIARFVIKDAKCRSKPFRIFLGEADQHGLGIVIAGCEQIIGFCQCLIQHGSKIHGFYIPMLLKMLNSFPLEVFSAPVIGKVFQISFFDFL